MTDKTLRGRFVWHELITPDTEAAHRYYNDVFHWKTARWDENPSFAMFSTGGERIGGTVELTDGAPRWLHYIGTTDMEATIDEATGLGARVITQPTVITGASRYAVLADPEGIEFGLYSSSTPPAEDRTARRGEFSWLELMASDADAALRFYCTLFGWERTAAHDMGDLGLYYLFGRNGRDIGGAFTKPQDMPMPVSWWGYIRAKDVDTVVSKAKAGGGKLINGPTEVPGGDWIAQFVDPQGATFAAHVVKEDVLAAKAAASRPSAAPPKAAVKVRKSVTNKSTAVAKKSTAPKKRAVAKKNAVKKAKSVKRSAGKAGRVRTRSQKVHKAKAATRKKAGTKKKAARPKKGK